MKWYVIAAVIAFLLAIAVVVVNFTTDVFSKGTSAKAGGVLKLEPNKFYRLDASFTFGDLTVRDSCAVVSTVENGDVRAVAPGAMRMLSQNQILFFSNTPGSLQPVCELKKNINGEWQLQDNAVIGETRVAWEITAEELSSDAPVTKITLGTSNPQIPALLDVFGTDILVFDSGTHYLSNKGMLPFRCAINFEVQKKEGQTTVVNVTESEVSGIGEGGSVTNYDSVITSTDFQVTSVVDIEPLGTL